jgi:hypothetical protein
MNILVINPDLPFVHNLTMLDFRLDRDFGAGPSGGCWLTESG